MSDIDDVRRAAMLSRRVSIAAQLEELRTLCEERGGVDRHCEQAMTDLGALLAQIDGLLGKEDGAVTREERRRKNSAAWANRRRDQSWTILASLPHTPRSEVRVAVREVDGQQLVDVRVWRLVEGAAPKPTIKGVALPATLLDTVISALQAAHQRL